MVMVTDGPYPLSPLIDLFLPLLLDPNTHLTFLSNFIIITFVIGLIVTLSQRCVTDVFIWVFYT